MKLKEIPRTATFAWSPDPVVPTIVTGTAAGTIDADFSAATELELWKLDLLDHSVAAFSASPSAHVETDARFHDIAVSGDGKTVVGALENGAVEAWSLPDLKSVARNDSAHVGAVKSVAFSPKEPTKFATGGTQGQVFVWNVQDMQAPFAPGTAAAQRHDDVESVGWNSTNAHILASAGNKGFASIWDTKRKREVLHLHYASPITGSRVPISTVQWHPTNSTKLATASLDDNDPVVCIWDLRNVNSPERVLRGHTKGVLSMDWCRQDENLLISGGRDNATLLWNPESGEQLGAYPISVEWAFKTKFNQRMPDLFASASFDGKISVQTLQDAGATSTTSASEASNTQDGSDFWERDTVMDTVHPSFKLQQPPKWLGRPISATFGFGGKLVVSKKGKVSVHTVTDSALDSGVTKSFGEALKSQNFDELAASKPDAESWKLLSALLKGETLSIPEEPLNPKTAASEDGDDEDEFDIVPPFNPSGDFELLSSKYPSVTAAVLANDLDSAVSQLISKNQAGDALLIASFGGPDLVKRAQNAYLNAHAADEAYLRAAWAVATKSPQDIVEHAELKAWPAILRSVLTSNDAATKKQATHRLGQRLLQASEPENALKTFLAGGNVGAAASLWLDELPQLEKKIVKEEGATAYVAHVKALQQAVEQIAAASSKLGLPPITDPGADRLYSAFRDYADLAAQQGDLDLAKLLLDMLPEEYAADKQRVHVATQQKQTVGSRQRPASSVAPSTIPTAGAQLNGGTGLRSSPVPKSAPTPHVGPSSAGPKRAGAVRVGASPASPLSSGGSVYAANPYAPAGVSPAAASVAASNAAAQAGPIPTAASVASPPPPPPVNGSSVAPPPPSAPFKGWNDIPELPSGARRTPAAPKRVAPPKATPTVGPPSASASPRGSVAAIPPPPSASVGSLPSASVGVSTPSSHPVAPPPPATSRPSNPYAPKAGSNSSSRAASVSAKPNPYAPSPSATPPAAAPSPGPARPGSTGPPPRARAAPPPPVAGAQAVASPPPQARPVAPPPVAGSQPPVAPPTATPASATHTSLPPSGKQPRKASTGQLPDNLKPIYNGFHSELKRIQPVVESQYTKQYRDTVRRLDILYDQLPTLSEPLVSILFDVASMISSRDYSSIQGKVQTIATDYTGETGEWFAGVRRLVKMSEGVPV